MLVMWEVSSSAALFFRMDILCSQHSGQHVPYATPDTCIIGFKAVGFLIGGERLFVTSKVLEYNALRHVGGSILGTMLGIEANGPFIGSQGLFVAREGC